MRRKVYQTAAGFIEQNSTLDRPLAYCQDWSALAQPLTVWHTEIRNRLVCQAMEGCDGTVQGEPGALTIRRYERLAKGGAGLIWFEATAVCREGRANPRQLLINEDTLDSFKRIVEQMKEWGLKANGFAPMVIMQATHSGRYSKPEGVPAPLIAYNNPVLEGKTPIDGSRILTDGQLDRIGEQLVHAAVLAEKAGFDGVDIKCCHRYLNSELLSAFTRKGRYGGSFVNRTRLLRESVKGAAEACGSGFIVTSRLNVYDGFAYPYGFGAARDSGIQPDYTEPDMLIKELEKLGVPLLNITMGNPYSNPHVNRPYAAGGYEPPEHPLCGVARMLWGTEYLQKRNPGVKLISSGLTYLGAAAPGVAAAFVQKGGFAMAGFGRMIFAYPDFARDIVNGCFNPAKECIACSKCTEIMRSGGTPGCIVRDAETYMPIYKKYCR